MAAPYVRQTATIGRAIQLSVYGTIVCLGDSLTHGARDEYGRGFPFELSDLLSEKFVQDWVCADEGVNGDTSSDVLRRAINACKKYSEAHEYVLLVGTNDSKDSVATPAMVYRQNLLGILRIMRVYRKFPYLCTIPLLQGFGAPDYTRHSNVRIRGYNEVLRQLALDDEVPLIELEELEFSAFVDGVHLGNGGNRAVAERIGAVIEETRRFEVLNQPTNDAPGTSPNFLTRLHKEA